LTDWSSVSFIFKRFKCKKRRFHRILSTIPALFAQAQPTFETQHLEFRRKGPFIAAFSMGKGDLPLPHFSKQTWVCAFFITSVESFYRDEKIVHSRAYVFFTTVKIRTIESAHFVVQFFSCENGTFVAKNWALLFPQPMRSVCYGEGGRRWLILEVTMSIIRDEMGCFHLFPRAIVHRALISGRF